MKTSETSVISRSKWMTCPKIEVEYPGLAYITPLSELIVVKQTDILHRVIGKQGTGYTIFNNEGEKVFLAVQKTRCKRFDLKIFNYYGNEVIQVKRPFKLCYNSAIVWAPAGNLVGSVIGARCRTNTFQVKNLHGHEVMKIKADGYQSVYKITSGQEEIGVVSKKNSPRTNFGTKCYGITFPVDASIGIKAVLLGACFLIGCLKY